MFNRSKRLSYLLFSFLALGSTAFAETAPGTPTQAVRSFTVDFEGNGKKDFIFLDRKTHELAVCDANNLQNCARHTTNAVDIVPIAKAVGKGDEILAIDQEGMASVCSVAHHAQTLSCRPQVMADLASRVPSSGTDRGRLFAMGTANQATCASRDGVRLTCSGVKEVKPSDDRLMYGSFSNTDAQEVLSLKGARPELCAIGGGESGCRQASGLADLLRANRIATAKLLRDGRYAVVGIHEQRFTVCSVTEVGTADFHCVSEDAPQTGDWSAWVVPNGRANGPDRIEFHARQDAPSLNTARGAAGQTRPISPATEETTAASARIDALAKMAASGQGGAELARVYQEGGGEPYEFNFYPQFQAYDFQMVNAGGAFEVYHFEVWTDTFGFTFWDYSDFRPKNAEERTQCYAQCAISENLGNSHCDLLAGVVAGLGAIATGVVAAGTAVTTGPGAVPATIYAAGAASSAAGLTLLICRAGVSSRNIDCHARCF
ncbi:MAG: hypothetical protein JNM52_01055 [Betaproteobacteria bacterium]|nr:hypothetical protein [Betaproteobacteria bacterium]